MKQVVVEYRVKRGYLVPATWVEADVATAIADGRMSLLGVVGDPVKHLSKIVLAGADQPSSVMSTQIVEPTPPVAPVVRP